MQNRDVRKTMEFIAREQRCKIKEIGLKQESLKFIGNMKHSWRASAETVENIRFGEHPAGGPDRRGTKTGSAGSWFFRTFIGIFCAACVISGEIYRGNG